MQSRCAHPFNSYCVHMCALSKMQVQADDQGTTFFDHWALALSSQESLRSMRAATRRG
eukprot:m.521841 g.521841  ORF g.521841 m.521841 type:complete len:58 (-) comp21964_c0_seq7:407-580(-)